MNKLFGISVMLSVLMINGALAFSFSDVWNKAQSNIYTIDQPEKNLEIIENDYVKVSDVLAEANSNQKALQRVAKTEINSLTIVTDKRVVNLALQDGKIVETKEQGEYTIKTTEKKLQRLWNDYQNNQVTTQKLLDTFFMPLNLKWKIFVNIWG